MKCMHSSQVHSWGERILAPVGAPRAGGGCDGEVGEAFSVPASERRVAVGRGYVMHVR